MIGRNKVAMMACSLFMGVQLTTFAAMGPKAHESMQKEAQEVLVIEVVKAETPKGTDEIPFYSIIYTVKVISAERSKSGLKKGQTIQINAKARNRSNKSKENFILGDWESTLAKNWKGKAYLNSASDAKNKKEYQPASRRTSFQKQ